MIHLKKISQGIVAKDWFPSITVVAIIRLFYYTSSELPLMTPDSYMYSSLSATLVPDIFIGLSNGRPPLYPFLLYLTSGYNIAYFPIIIACQMIVSLMAVIYFFKTVKLLTRNNLTSTVATILYGGCSSIIVWDTAILTESFALSCVVFFLYMLVKYLHSPAAKWAVGVFIILLLLSFLRPTSLLMYYITCIFFLLRFMLYRNERPFLKHVLLLFLLGTGLLFAYSYLMLLNYSVFSLTDALPRQLLHVTIERGYYLNSSSASFIDNIEYALANYDKLRAARDYILAIYPGQAAQNLATEAIMQSLPKYIADTSKLLVSDLTKTIALGSYNTPNSGNRLVAGLYIVLRLPSDLLTVVKYGHLYLIATIQLIVSISLWVKKCRVPWLMLILSIFIISIPLSTYVATNAEFGRTMVHVLPFFYLSASLLAHTLCCKYQNNTQKQLNYIA